MKIRPPPTNTFILEIGIIWSGMFSLVWESVSSSWKPSQVSSTRKALEEKQANVLFVATMFFPCRQFSQKKNGLY
jgi:hypothetical protein